MVSLKLAPLEMISTVIMCGKGGEQGLVKALSDVWNTEGLKGLFKGNGANCLKVAPSRGTQFLVYEAVKRQLLATQASVGPLAATRRRQRAQGLPCADLGCQAQRGQGAPRRPDGSA